MKDLKIALIGNMNNNFFVLARYLRDEGFNCAVFALPYEPAHFSANSDSNSEEDIQLVQVLPWGNAQDLFSLSPNTINAQFEEYNFFIACGTAPAFLTKAGIAVDLFIPYGSDLYLLPFAIPKNPLKWLSNLHFRKFQKRGIKGAAAVSIADNATVFQNALNKIGFKGLVLKSGVPMVYAPRRINHEVFSKEDEVPKKRIKILHPSRHAWKTEKDPVSLKDNNKLFEGVALFITNHPSIEVIVYTMEYGSDINASKELIAELGIERNVKWFPTMARKDLMSLYHEVDIVVGELRNSWFTYGVIYEAMVAAKPVIHYRKDDLYADLKLYPMYSASSAQQVCDRLSEYAENPQNGNRIGYEARSWYFEECVQKVIVDIEGLLKRKLQG